MTASGNRPETSPYRGALFLHIPKTAGSALTDTFCFNFAHFIRDAHLPGSAWRDVVAGEDGFFISGHFSFSDVAETIGRSDVFSFTVLRDPVEQVVSNVRWVKAYGDPERADKLSELSPSIAEVAKRLWTVSLSDVEGLSEVLQGPGAWPFRNVQTVLLQDEQGAVGTRSAAEMVECAMVNLERFNLYFVLEDVAHAFAVLQRAVGALEPLKRSNQAVLEERPNLDDGNVRAFYSSLVDLDLQVFAKAKRASRLAMAEMI